LFGGPVVVDLDDPTHTPEEQAALSTPNIRYVIVTTDALAHYVEETNPCVDVLVMPQGVDLARATRAEHATVRKQLLAHSFLAPEAVIVGYHAPIICLSTDPGYRSDAFRHFHIDALFEAVQRLWSDDLPFLTVLLGNSSPTIRSVACSERRLVLKEYVDRERLFDWVGAFDIGTYPRTVDFGGRQSVKLLEYMATGAATVAMATSETSFLEENSLGYTAADADGFYRSLRRLIVDHDSRRALGERSRKYVQRHDWDALAVRYDGILASAAEPA
jgi:glycosyltransferase involved in cell wall biosynthesis